MYSQGKTDGQYDDTVRLWLDWASEECKTFLESVVACGVPVGIDLADNTNRVGLGKQK